VRNFFGNIGDVFIGVNNFLQGKFEEGVSDWARVAFNSTVGLFGIHDIATDMGYEKHNEDFGQTFGRWGARPGPYLILPILGSSTVRDGIGTGIDLYVDPLTQVRPYHLEYGLVGLRLTQTRADLLDASRILEEAALDKYVFQRDAYLQFLLQRLAAPRAFFEEGGKRLYVARIFKPLANAGPGLNLDGTGFRTRCFERLCACMWASFRSWWF